MQASEALHEILQEHQKTALIFEEQHVSYTQLFQEVAKYARLFQAQECKKVAIYSEKSFGMGICLLCRLEKSLRYCTY